MVAKRRSQNGQAQNVFFSVERAMPCSLPLRTLCLQKVPYSIPSLLTKSVSSYRCKKIHHASIKEKFEVNTVLSFLVASQAYTQNVILISFCWNCGHQVCRLKQKQTLCFGDFVSVVNSYLESLYPADKYFSQVRDFQRLSLYLSGWVTVGLYPTGLPCKLCVCQPLNQRAWSQWQRHQWFHE